MFKQSSLLYIVAILTFAIYNIHALYYASNILTRFKKRRVLFLCLALFNTSCLFFLYTFYVPYYVSYLVGLALLTLEFLCFSKSKFRQAYFGATTFMIHIICIHMTMVALMAFLLRRPLLDIFLDHDLFCWNIILSFLIAEIFLSIFKYIVPIKDILFVSRDKVQSVMISLICTFIILYSCFDSFMLINPTSYSNITLTIISTNLLSAVLYYNMLIHGIRISRMTHFRRRAAELELELIASVRYEEKLKSLAFKDNLTACYSRSYILDFLDDILTKRKTGYCLAYIDMDGLKSVNDAFGHNEGDTYLLNTSRSIAAALRGNDVLARMGGDEFMLILLHCMEQDACAVLERAQQNLDLLRHDLTQGKPYAMSISYGIVFVDDTIAQMKRQEIIRMADQKMYAFKAQKQMTKQGEQDHEPSDCSNTPFSL